MSQNSNNSIKIVKSHIIKPSISMLKELYFIENGKTNTNINLEKFDQPLNDIGIHNSIKTGKYLKKYRENNDFFQTIYSSPMARAYHTATLIADTIGIDYNDIIVLNDLMDQQTISTDETKIETAESRMKKLYMNDLDKIIDPIEKYKIGDYENWKQSNSYIYRDLHVHVENDQELSARVDNVMTNIIESPNNKIIIVSHDNFLRSIIKKLFGLDVIPDGNIDNDAHNWISYITVNDGKYELISPPNNEHLKLSLMQ